jgi:DNA-binding transcriptional regulator YhcF (GntR family)
MKATLDDRRPIFLQIKESIEEDILNGRLKSDEQIPSTRQLVSFYNINPVTALKGVDLLAKEGIVYKKRGEGVFVSPDAQKRLRERFRENFVLEQVEPLVGLAKPLGISKNELHTMIDQIWKESAP